MRMRKWCCELCDFVYDEALGFVEDEIEPGTRWEDVPDDWTCPDCGIAKAHFYEMDEAA